MKTLFGDLSQAVSAEELRESFQTSPHFLKWALGTLSQGLLDSIIKELMSGGARTKKETLEILCRTAESSEKQPSLIFSDLNGVSTSPIPQALKHLLDPQRTEASQRMLLANLFWRFGTISHSVILECLERIPRASEKARSFFKEERQLRFPLSGEQLKLFDESLLKPAFAQKDVLKGEHLSDRYLKRLEECWKTLVEIFNDDGPWFGKVFEGREPLEELQQLLFPLFGSQIEKLIKHATNADYLGEYLLMATLMSWISVLLESHGRKKRILFKELPVLNPLIHGISGGRVDAVEIIGRKAKPLTGISGRINSISDLMANLPGDSSVRIIDIKCSVGDGRPPDSLIKEKDLDSPLLPHLLQIQGYIVFTTLSSALNGSEQIGENPWWENSSCQSGQLMYCLPNRTICHPVTMFASEKKQIFQETVVAKWDQALAIAGFRTVSRTIWDVIQSELAKKSRRCSKKNRRKRDEGGTLVLRQSEKNGKTVEEIIDKHRSFLDEDAIVEITGKKKDGGLILHLRLDRLTKAITDGRVKTDRFTERGGFIRCLNPEHNDKTPSMNIWVEGGLFKCFACGIAGKLIGTGTLGKFEIRASSSANAKSQFQKTSRIAVPDEHREIMREAQGLLQAAFVKSRQPQEYLEKRCLDPERAYDLGAGFGTYNLIAGLLAGGYSLERIAHYGFIGFSTEISIQNGFVRMLLEKGVTLEEMEAAAQTVDKAGGLPYSVLGQRLTFPLDLPGKIITSFYGRAIQGTDRRRAHRKLIRHTYVPHGGFNLGILDSDCAEIYVTEGVADALSLMELGNNSALAMIGVENQAILEAIARAGKTVWLCLDMDPTGEYVTTKLQERFKKQGVEARNFVPHLLADFQHLAVGVKDVNELLQTLRGLEEAVRE